MTGIASTFLNLSQDTNLGGSSPSKEIVPCERAIKIYVDNHSGGGSALPTGTVLPFAGSTVPDGYLLCDGSAVSRTTYADLFAIIGTAYGAGDGSTTFNIPNTISRYLGYNGQGYLGESLPAHTHSGNTGYVSADHSHSRGSMDITGVIGQGDCSAGTWNATRSGAFYFYNQSSRSYQFLRENYGNTIGDIGFKASNNWTGYTSGITANHYHGFTTGNPSSAVYSDNASVKPLTCRVNCIIKY